MEQLVVFALNDEEELVNCLDFESDTILRLEVWLWGTTPKKVVEFNDEGTHAFSATGTEFLDNAHEELQSLLNEEDLVDDLWDLVDLFVTQHGLQDGCQLASPPYERSSLTY